MSSRALAAGPEAVSTAANVAATSGRVGDASGGGAWPAPTRTSSTALLRSEWRSYASPRSSRVIDATFPIAVMIADQPRPADRWSASGNGRPVRKTAAIGSSSGVRLRR